MGDTKSTSQNCLYHNEEEKVKEQEEQRSIDTTNSATEIKGNWEGEHGRIDRTMIERQISEEEIDNAIFYICGPPGMINALEEGLLKKHFHIPKERIKVEEFTGYKATNYTKSSSSKSF